MIGKGVNLEDKKVNKSNFYKNKKLFKIDDIDVNKILVSKKEPYGKESSFKYFIGYNDNDDIRPLCVKLPQMIGYAKYVDIYKTMSLQAIDRNLLKNYSKIWGKISSLMNIEFDFEPVYGDSNKHIKTKIKSYGDKVNTNIQCIIQVFVIDNARFCC